VVVVVVVRQGSRLQLTAGLQGLHFTGMHTTVMLWFILLTQMQIMCGVHGATQSSQPHRDFITTSPKQHNVLLLT
jgi:hypothetical protein